MSRNCVFTYFNFNIDGHIPRVSAVGSSDSLTVLLPE